MESQTATKKAGTVFPGLPAFAFVPDPYQGNARPAIIYPGDNVYYSPRKKLLGPDATLQDACAALCAAMNAARGVMPQQAAAMAAGIKYGWDDPRADPANYDAMGQFKAACTG